MRRFFLMKLQTAWVLAIVPFLVSLTGCAAIGGIFKAGMWVGILIVGGLVLLGGLAFGLARR